MTYLVLVEPAHGQRRDFARWCLAQDPQIQTASHTGFEVPSDLFVNMPEALLVGARIDGQPYRHVVEDSSPVAVPVDDGASPEQLTENRVGPAPRRTRRKAGEK